MAARSAAKPAPPRCSQCDAEISRGKPGGLGLCRKCVYSSPEFKRRRAEAIRAVYKRPGHREKMARIVAENHRKAREESPEFRQWLHDHGKQLGRLLQSPEIRAKLDDPEVRARQAKGVSEAKIGWCPPEYRAEYRSLIRSKRMPGAEARRIIEEQIAKAAEAEKRRPKTFEEKLRAVMEGRASVVTMPVANSEHDFTLAGVSSGWTA